MPGLSPERWREDDEMWAKTREMRDRIYRANKRRASRCRDCGQWILFLIEIVRKPSRTGFKERQRNVPVTIGTEEGQCRLWHRHFRGVNGNLKHQRHKCDEERKARWSERHRSRQKS